jgi:hypothetical protein
LVVAAQKNEKEMEEYIKRVGTEMFVICGTVTWTGVAI